MFSQQIVVVPRANLEQGILPHVCVISGRSENVRSTQFELTCTPLWLGVAALAAPFLAGSGMAAEYAIRAWLPVSQDAFDRWERRNRRIWLSLVGSVALFLAAGFSGAAEYFVLSIACFIGMVLLPGVAFVSASRAGPRLVSLSGDSARVAIPSTAAARAIRSFLELRTV